MAMKTMAPPKAGDFALTPFARQSSVRPLTLPRWLRVIAAWIERDRQRRALAALDGPLLADIGITRTAAAHEIAKPFWR